MIPVTENIVLDENEIVLLTIYAKAKQSDIKDNDIRNILKKIDL